MIPFHTDELAHNSETAHRLPQLAGKCESLHGHSWLIRVAVGFPALDQHGIGVEFGAFKKGLRGWIDQHLDHGTILGAADPLVPVLAGFRELKVYRFGAADPTDEEKPAGDLEWPTVENVAVLLYRVAGQVLASCESAPGGWVHRVHVTETGVNAATFEFPRPEPREAQVVSGAHWAFP